MLAVVVIATDQGSEPAMFDYYRPALDDASFLLRFSGGSAWYTAHAYSQALTATLRGTSSPFILVTFDFVLPASDLAHRVVHALTTGNTFSNNPSHTERIPEVHSEYSFVVLSHTLTHGLAKWNELNYVSNGCLTTECGIGVVYR